MSIPLKPFYFIRHGETEWNKLNIFMGISDIPLNNTGIEQAYNAQKLIKNLDIIEICSSPLQRTRQTAEILNEQLNLSINYFENLQEKKLGSGEGKLAEEYHANAPYEGEENWEDFKKRVTNVLSEILINHQTPLIVSHGGVFKALVEYLGHEVLPIANCDLFSFTPIEEKNKNWKITKI